MLAKLLFATARAMKPGNSATLEDVLRYFRGPASMASPNPFILKAGVKSEQKKLGGSSGTYLTPTNFNDSVLILYLHSGGYVGGPFINEWEFLSYLANELKTRAFSPDYPLAPESPYPAAFNQVHNLYNTLAADYKQIVLIGSSAGGGLALSLLNHIVEREEHIPSAACLLSPWVDLNPARQNAQSNESKDAFLNNRILSLSAEAYAGHNDYSNPLISPINAKNIGLPPSYLSAGSDEILANDLQLLAAKMVENSCNVVYHEGKNQPHIWPTFFMIPEAKQEIRRIGEFLRSHLDR